MHNSSLKKLFGKIVSMIKHTEPTVEEVVPTKPLIDMPYEVCQLYAIIESYNPMLVGGCVRDHIMGKVPKDFDFVVSKLDDTLSDIIEEGGWSNKKVVANSGTQIWNLCKYFPVYETIPNTNIKFLSSWVPYVIELIQYENGTIKHDADRRDLTINSLYYDIKNNQILDPTGKGLDDINNKIIRFNSKRVVYDDRLRIVRAYRFAKTFGFTIEPNSLALCRTEFNTMVEVIRPARLLQEIEKICL